MERVVRGTSCGWDFVPFCEGLVQCRKMGCVKKCAIYHQIENARCSTLSLTEYIRRRYVPDFISYASCEITVNMSEKPCFAGILSHESENTYYT